MGVAPPFQCLLLWYYRVLGLDRDQPGAHRFHDSLDRVHMWHGLRRRSDRVPLDCEALQVIPEPVHAEALLLLVRISRRPRAPGAVNIAGCRPTWDARASVLCA